MFRIGFGCSGDEMPQTFSLYHICDNRAKCSPWCPLLLARKKQMSVRKLDCVRPLNVINWDACWVVSSSHHEDTNMHSFETEWYYDQLSRLYTVAKRERWWKLPVVIQKQLSTFRWGSYRTSHPCSDNYSVYDMTIEFLPDTAMSSQISNLNYCY